MCSKIALLPRVCPVQVGDDRVFVQQDHWKERVAEPPPETYSIESIWDEMMASLDEASTRVLSCGFVITWHVICSARLKCLSHSCMLLFAGMGGYKFHNSLGLFMVAM